MKHAWPSFVLGVLIHATRDITYLFDNESENNCGTLLPTCPCPLISMFLVNMVGTHQLRDLRLSPTDAHLFSSMAGKFAVSAFDDIVKRPAN